MSTLYSAASVHWDLLPFVMDFSTKVPPRHLSQVEFWTLSQSNTVISFLFSRPPVSLLLCLGLLFRCKIQFLSLSV